VAFVTGAKKCTYYRILPPTYHTITTSRVVDIRIPA
jgi:hypothetical protein